MNLAKAYQTVIDDLYEKYDNSTNQADKNGYIDLIRQLEMLMNEIE